MLTLTYSADIYTVEKVFIGKAIVMSNTKELAVLALDEDVFNELTLDAIVEFYDEIKGIITSRCTISNMHRPAFAGDNYTCTCKIISILDVLQRRKDVYARINIDVDLHVIKAMRTLGIDRSLDLEESSFKGTLRNISAGGMYFESTKKVLKGSYVALFCEEIMGKNNEIICAEILRVELTNENPNNNLINSVVAGEEIKQSPDETVFGYGCRFIDLTRSLESKLRQYVFNENRKQFIKRRYV